LNDPNFLEGWLVVCFVTHRKLHLQLPMLGHRWCFECSQDETGQARLFREYFGQTVIPEKEHREEEKSCEPESHALNSRYVVWKVNRFAWR